MASRLTEPAFGYRPIDRISDTVVNEDRRFVNPASRCLLRVAAMLDAKVYNRNWQESPYDDTSEACLSLAFLAIKKCPG